MLILFVLCSYRENSALGDPNSLVEDLLQIRNKVRIKEADLAMIKGKVGVTPLFNLLHACSQCIWRPFTVCWLVPRSLCFLG